MSFLDKAGLTYLWGKLKSYFQSLGPGTAIAANTDLNTIGTVGNYHCASTNTAQSLSNCPCAVAFTMKVGYATGTGYIYQEISRYSGGDKWYRYVTQNTFDSTKWSKWYPNTSRSLYATCTTAADTAAKVVTLADNVHFNLYAGVIVGVKFSYTNTAQNPTLNVNGSGAKSVYYNTAVITTGSLGAAGHANRVIYYMYDGTNWCFMAWGNDTNTTYSAMSQTEYDTGTSTTGRLVTPELLKTWITAATPTYTAVTGKPTGNQTPAFGGTATISQVKQDATGQVSFTDRTIKIPNTEASTSAAGLMSAGDKTKLNGVEEGAQVNPTYTAVTGKPTGNQTPAFGGTATVSQVSQNSSGQISVTDRTIKIPNTEATTAESGLMSADDKTKLNGIDEGAEVNRTYTAVTGKPTGNQTPAFGATFTISQIKQDATGQITATDRTVKIPNTAASTSSEGLMSADDKTKLNYTNVAYGTCDTAAGTAAKVVTISGNTKFALQPGAIVGIKFTYTNTAASPTLNVGGTGAKGITWQATQNYTGANWVGGQAGYTNYYMYDGTNYVFMGHSQDNNTTYSSMSQTEYDTGTATTGRLVTAALLKAWISSATPTYTETTGKPTANQTPAFGGTATISQVKQATSGQLTVTDRTIKIPDTEASTSSHGLMSADDKTKLNYTNIAYATCSTAAATAAKVATISGNTKFSLQTGAIVGVKFTNTNTAQNPTLNVGSTGAKSVVYNTAVVTTGSLNLMAANRVTYFMYDGTNWVFLSWSVDNNTTYSAMSQTEADTGTATTARLITAKVLTDTIVSKVGTPTIDYFIQDKTNIDPISATYYYSDNFTIPAGYWCLSVAVEWNAVNSTQDAEEYREAVLLKASDSSAPGIISYDRVAAISRATTYNRFVFPVKLTSATAYKIRLKHNNGAILTAKVRAYWVGLAT